LDCWLQDIAECCCQVRLLRLQQLRVTGRLQQTAREQREAEPSINQKTSSESRKPGLELIREDDWPQVKLSLSHCVQHYMTASFAASIVVVLHVQLI